MYYHAWRSSVKREKRVGGYVEAMHHHDVMLRCNVRLLETLM